MYRFLSPLIVLVPQDLYLKSVDCVACCVVRLPEHDLRI